MTRSTEPRQPEAGDRTRAVTTYFGDFADYWDRVYASNSVKAQVYRTRMAVVMKWAMTASRPDATAADVGTGAGHRRGNHDGVACTRPRDMTALDSATHVDAAAPARPRRVCVVGPSPHFLSGITYYTYGLCGALDGRFEVSAILMRRLLPRRLYPGRRHVGLQLSRLELPPTVAAYDGVDWFWLPSLIRAVRFLRAHRPEVVVFQWWTAAVLHSYLALAVAARLADARLVIEFHESQDVGEAKRRGMALYSRLAGPALFKLADGSVVHSHAEREAVAERFPTAFRSHPTAVVPHAAYRPVAADGVLRDAPPGVCNLLYFGVVREYKGVEVLVEAFSSLPPEEAAWYWLTIVGETWEGWDAPARLIASSPYRDRITRVDRYVTDDEVSGFLAGADIVVLPYRRCSQSGPFHLAMGAGLPAVVTDVGGLAEAARTYAGAVAVAPDDPAALLDGIRRAVDLVGRHFDVGHDWPATSEAFGAVIEGILGAA